MTFIPPNADVNLQRALRELADAIKAKPDMADVRAAIPKMMPAPTPPASSTSGSPVAVLWTPDAQGNVNLDTPGGKAQVKSLGIGQAPSSYLLQLVSDSAAKPATATWAVSSDARSKHDVRELQGSGMAIIKGLRLVRYTYNGQLGTPAGVRGVGVIAQELLGVLPEAVIPAYPAMAVNYHAIIMMALRAIQELSARVEALEAAK